jgi:hypothetical protein
VKKLFDAGELTDSTGKKIDDMSNIKFDDASDPLAKGLSNLTDSINNLVKLLGGDVPAAAAAAADGITDHLSKITVPTIDVHYKLDGGDGSPIPMASGGDFLVSKPTLFLAGEAGPERATFSGAGRTSQTGTITDAHLDQLKKLNQRLAFVDNLPDDMARAVKVAMQFAS